jgi:hypothetical protein
MIRFKLFCGTEQMGYLVSCLGVGGHTDYVAMGGKIEAKTREATRKKRKQTQPNRQQQGGSSIQPYFGVAGAVS